MLGTKTHMYPYSNKVVNFSIQEIEDKNMEYPVSLDNTFFGASADKIRMS